MKLLYKRNPALLAVLVFCLVVAALVPAAASASSYESYIWFDQFQQGQTRYYDGTNIHFEANVVSIPSGNTLSWSMALYRDTFWGETKIGTTKYYSCPQTVSPDWYTGQAGDYFFRFYSTDDGLSVYDDKVQMWSN